MKKIIYYIIIFLLILVAYRCFIYKKGDSKPEEKYQSLELKKHSAAFNQSVNSILDAYLSIEEGLVKSDTAKVKASAGKLIQLLNQIDTVELKKDTAAVFETVMMTIGDMQFNLSSLENQTDLQGMRKDFSSLTDVMYPTFFKAIQYEGATIYLQNCPMAFGEDMPANWISNHADIVNPYLGDNHPVYKSSMLHCGELKDSITAQ